MKKIIALILTLCLLLPALAMADLTDQKFFIECDFTIAVPKGFDCNFIYQESVQLFRCYKQFDEEAILEQEASLKEDTFIDCYGYNDTMSISKIQMEPFDFTKCDPAQGAQDALDREVAEIVGEGYKVIDQQVLQAGWIDLQGVPVLGYTISYIKADDSGYKTAYCSSLYRFSLPEYTQSPLDNHP